MMIPWLALFDFGTFRANFKKPLDLSAVKARSSDFALLVPIFNDTKYLTNIDFLKKYSDRVILCTTTNETEEFYQSLKKLADKHGFRISYSEVKAGKKNPWVVYNKTLLAHDAVLKDTITRIDEKYVIFIDGDTFVDGDLETLCGAMEENNFDIASVKVLPSKRENLIENLQGVEYDIAMQARLIYPWLTSGAGMVSKKKVMEKIMKNHSLFFNGGDIEIGKLADMMGYKVGHIPIIFYTDVPTTFMKWVKQRFSWMCGCFRHSIVNMHHNLNHPFHFIYFSFIIYFLYPFKVVEMFKNWYMFPLIVALYALITFFANWKVRNKYMFIFPFYALFQVLVILWFGIYRYFTTVYKTENIGLIRLKTIHRPKPRFTYIYNYSLAIGGVLLIMLGANGFAQKAILGRQYESIEIISAVFEFAKDKIYLMASAASTRGNVLLNYTNPESNVAGMVVKNTNESNQSDKDYYEVAVFEGDGGSKIARKAIRMYLDENKLELDAHQRIYLEDSMKHDVYERYGGFRPGMVVRINKDLIRSKMRLAFGN